jgi:hypothetical protein
MAGFFRIDVRQISLEGVLSYYDSYTDDWVVLNPIVSRDTEYVSRPFPYMSPEEPLPHKLKIEVPSGINIEDYEYVNTNAQDPEDLEYPDNRTVIINYPEGFPYSEPNKNYDFGIYDKKKLFSVSNNAKLFPIELEYLYDICSFDYLQTNMEFLNSEDLVAVEGSYLLEFYPKNEIELSNRLQQFRYHGDTIFSVYDDELGRNIEYALMGWYFGNRAEPSLVQYINEDNLYGFYTSSEVDEVIYPLVVKKVDKGTLKMWTGEAWERVN